MTQTILEMVTPLDNIQEEFHNMLLKFIGKKDSEPIYQKTFMNEGEIDEVRYFEQQEGEYVKGCLLKRFDVITTGSEMEYMNVKKEIFILDDGEMVVFNHVDRYFEDSDTYFTTLYREMSPDQTLTAKEFVSLIDMINAEIDNSSVE